MTLAVESFVSLKWIIRCLCICVCFRIPPIYGDNFVSSLPQLELDLQSAIKEARAKDSNFSLFDWNDVSKLPQAMQVEALGAPIWIEILERSPNSASAHIGFLCILRHREDLATHATFVFLLSQPQSMMIAEVTQAGPRLKSLAPTQANLNDFTAIMSNDFNTPEKRMRIVGVIALLPTAFLEAWWMSEKSAVLAPTQEALILNQLAALKARQELSEQCGAAVEERMKTLSDVPGFPRLVSVMNSPESNDHVARELRSLIGDDTISDVEFAMAIVFHRDLVKKIIGDLNSVQGETASRRSAVIRKRIIHN